MKKTDSHPNDNFPDNQMPAAGLAFEKSFMSVSLEQQFNNCDHNEELGIVVFPVIRKLLCKWLPLDATGHMRCYVVLKH